MLTKCNSMQLQPFFQATKLRTLGHAQHLGGHHIARKVGGPISPDKSRFNPQVVVPHVPQTIREDATERRRRVIELTAIGPHQCGWGVVMKTYEHELAHSYEHSKSILGYSSASFLQSLATALVVGTVAALIGMAASAALYYRHVAWYISAGVGPLVDTLVVIFLVTIALEQARKRSIRRTLELSFLNHHVRNALTQMIMASNVTDPGKQDRFMQEAVSRVSEALFRVANSADLTGLSLEVDLGGTELTREGEEREQKGARRAG